MVSTIEDGKRVAKKLRLEHTQALTRLLTTEVSSDHHTIFGDPLASVTTDGVGIVLRGKQREKLRKVRFTKSTNKRRQLANVDSCKAFRKETDEFRALKRKEAIALKVASEAGMEMARKEETVFFGTKHALKNSGRFRRIHWWEADVFIVSNFDYINVSKNYMKVDSTCLWCMVLGRRLAEESYLHAKSTQRLSTSCSIKYKPMYNSKELGWWVSPKLSKYEQFHNNMTFVCGQPGSKWTLLDQDALKRWTSNQRSAKKIREVNHFVDFEKFVRQNARIDKFGSSCGILKNVSRRDS